MPLGPLTRCWVQLEGVPGVENIYTGCIILIKNYSALSVVIGGREGVDGVRGHWMTCPINRTLHQLWACSSLGLLLGSLGSDFHRENNVLQ